MSFSTNSKELYILRDEIKRLKTILDALEKNIADVREAFLRKKEIIDQREHLKWQLNFMHDNLNKELARLNDINLKLQRRNEKF